MDGGGSQSEVGGEPKKGIMRDPRTQGGITGVINAANEAGSEGQGGLGLGQQQQQPASNVMNTMPMPAANAGRLSILQGQPGVGGPGGGLGPGGLGGPPGAGGGPGGMGKKSSSTSQLSAAGNISCSVLSL